MTSEPKRLTVHKHGITISLSAEQHYEMVWQQRYGAFKRRSHEETVKVQPDAIELYRTLKTIYDEVVRKLESNGFWESTTWDTEAGPREPRDYTHTVYSETEEQFEARVDEAYRIHDETGMWPRATYPHHNHTFGVTGLMPTEEWEAFKAASIERGQQMAERERAAAAAIIEDLDEEVLADRLNKDTLTDTGQVRALFEGDPYSPYGK